MRRPMNRRAWLKSCAGWITGLGLAPLVRAQANADVTHRQLRFSISITNPSSSELTNQILWVYLPVLETPTQRFERLRASIAHETMTDRLGHNILKLTFPHLAPFASRVVTVAADVALRSTPIETVLEKPAEWLAAERYLEVDDPRTCQLAAELKQPQAMATAKAIYDWIRQHLTYAGYVADDHGAVDALERRRGDCTEYAYLAVALARANGIPARMVGGYVIDRNAAPKPEDYHNWAEVHIDGSWRLLDAQKENWLTPAEQYVAFRIYRDEPLNPIGQAHRFRVNGEMRVRL
jgi:hypothetical protein